MSATTAANLDKGTLFPHKKLGTIYAHVFLTFQISEEIIPPSGDEIRIFLSLYLIQQVIRVLNPDVGQYETNGVDHAYVILPRVCL